MADFNEARSPLTHENVEAWARATFAASFRALPNVPASKWVEFDASSFRISRSIWRSLDRSQHKQLLVIGAYAPGPATLDEPTESVVAHLHADETDVSFYRIAESENGSRELLSVNSTSSVAFQSPFSHVGEDTGSSKAIHRVSALIMYYFLAAGHVTEVPRTTTDLTMFTRNFKDACSRVESGGERPIIPASRRSSTVAVTSPDRIVVRPKRSSTVVSPSLPPIHPGTPHPTLTRSLTDDLDIKRKRSDQDSNLTRVRKNPRRTLSEQIFIPKLATSDSSVTSVQSPRSPAPERVHRALTECIAHHKAKNADLQDRLNMETECHEATLAWLRRLEAQVFNLTNRVTLAEQDALQAKKMAAARAAVAPVAAKEGDVNTAPGCEAKGKRVKRRLAK